MVPRARGLSLGENLEDRMLSFFRAHTGSRDTHVSTHVDLATVDGDTRTSFMCPKQSLDSIAFTRSLNRGKTTMMNDQQTKNLRPPMRIVSKPVPLVGPGLRVKTQDYEIGDTQVSPTLTPSAKRLVQQRAVSQLVTIQVKPVTWGHRLIVEGLKVIQWTLTGVGLLTILKYLA